MTTTSGPELIALKGGVVVPLAAVLFLNDLEHRGFCVRVDEADGAIVVRPGKRLSAEDRRALAEHRDHLISLVRYCEAIQ